MSRGTDQWAPRRHGFDDDGPQDYSQRSRTQRTPRSDVGFEEAQPISSEANAAAVDAVVKWFKGEKGFGFVELSNGQGDAFLHIGALQSAGYETVPPGAKLKVSVGSGMKGMQVTRVFEVDTAGAAERAPQRPSFGDSPRPQRRAPDPSTA